MNDVSFTDLNGNLVVNFDLERPLRDNWNMRPRHSLLVFEDHLPQILVNDIRLHDNFSVDAIVIVFLILRNGSRERKIEVTNPVRWHVRKSFRQHWLPTSSVHVQLINFLLFLKPLRVKVFNHLDWILHFLSYFLELSSHILVTGSDQNLEVFFEGFIQLVDFILRHFYIL